MTINRTPFHRTPFCRRHVILIERDVVEVGSPVLSNAVRMLRSRLVLLLERFKFSRHKETHEAERLYNLGSLNRAFFKHKFLSLPLFVAIIGNMQCVEVTPGDAVFCVVITEVCHLFRFSVIVFTQSIWSRKLP